MPERNDLVPLRPWPQRMPNGYNVSLQRARVCWFLAAGLLLAAACGCRSFQADPIVERVPNSEAILLGQADAELPAAMMVAFENQLVETRRANGKSEQIDLWTESKSPGAYRWQNRGLEEIDAQYWSALMKSKTRPAAAAAVIGVARQARRASSELVDLVRDPNLSVATRRAAVETLAATASAETFDGVFDELSDPEKERFSKHVYAELIMSLALQETEPKDPRWLRGLADSEREPKLAVLRGWERLSRGPLPDAGRPLLTDPDHAIRAAALRAFAACEGEQHLSDVIAAIQTPNLALQAGAIQALGYIDVASSRTELRRLLKESSSELRAEAVSALARLRDFDTVDRVVATDRSWRVRLAAADSIDDRDGAEAADVAMQLVTDENPQVQAAAIQAIEDWNIRLSGPIYFHALDSQSILARRLAAEQLSNHWPTVLLFDPSVSAAQRRGQLKILRRVWPFGSLDRREMTESDSEQFGDWIDALQTAGSNREEAAESIAKMASRVYLDRRAVERLIALMAKADNRSVRRPLARAIASRQNQGFQSTLRMLLEDADSELNLIGIRYVERYGDLRDASLCRPFLTHSDGRMRLAAVIAIGEIGDSKAESMIVQRLGDSLFETRVAAAVALCSWGADSGLVALERFASSEDPSERRRAAAAMADVGRQTCLPQLLRMVEDRDDAVSQTASRSLICITGEKAPAITEDMNPADLRTAWKSWAASH
jgi:HEAT repeat protein